MSTSPPLRCPDSRRSPVVHAILLGLSPALFYVLLCTFGAWLRGCAGAAAFTGILTALVTLGAAIRIGGTAAVRDADTPSRCHWTTFCACCGKKRTRATLPVAIARERKRERVSPPGNNARSR
jgi:hypothetical protein